MNLRVLGNRASLLALLGACLGFGGSAQAQVVTNITPDVAAGRSTGTTTSVSGVVTTIDGGTLVGTNLFHSFAQFDLATGGIAQWDRTGGDAASVTRVINRVTGGNLSNINGELNTTAFANADFYFINPAGFIFGDGFNAQVPGGFHISTANQLNFADGAVFSATTPAGSTLTLAEPSSFGFVGGASGDIVFRAASPTTVALGFVTALSLNARDIEFDGLRVFVADSTTLIAAVGEGAASIPLSATGLSVNLAGKVTARSGGVSAALVNTTANGQGGIAISAGTACFRTSSRRCGSRASAKRRSSRRGPSGRGRKENPPVQRGRRRGDDARS